MKCGNSCRLFGAYQALSGIEDNIVLLHSVTGCHFGTMNFHVAGDMSDMRQTSTIINDKDVIFNGENSLRKALAYILELYNPGCITVITGCVSQMIGDDVEGVVSEFKHKVRCIHIQGAGFQSDFEEGYEEALLTFAKVFCKRTKRADEPTINILGMLYDDYKKEADINALKNLLKGKVRINCATAGCRFQDFEKLSGSQINIVFGRGKKLALYMEEKYGQPFIEVDYPYGLEGIKRFLSVLGNFFNLSFHQEIKRMEGDTLKAVKKVYSYLQAFYGLPVCLCGSKGRREGMQSFLRDELGMEIVSTATASADLCMEDFIESVLATDTALVFGSSFEADISDRLNVPLIQYDYPVFHRVCISDSPYIGAKGTIHLVEDILNAVMNGPKNKGALYDEKDMYLR